MISIRKNNKQVNARISLPASKSLSNRLLIIQHLCSQNFDLLNLSEANDTIILKRALADIKNNKKNIDAGEAGTAFRFLTVLLSITEGDFELKGSKKLMERPILPLVNALKSIGAIIDFNVDDGNNSLLIKGKKLAGGFIAIDANISSQFISALLMVAPVLTNGLTIKMTGSVVSFDYIKMTINLMQTFGIDVKFEDNTITVNSGNYTSKVPQFFIESDWSAASYWYSIALLSADCEIELLGLTQNSLQGDSIVALLFNLYGINTTFNQKSIVLHKQHINSNLVAFDFIDCPDLVQTFAFCHAALNKNIIINGAANLRLKETDRIEALKNELLKFNTVLETGNQHSLLLQAPVNLSYNLVPVKTYQDHRMAMAAAPLALKYNTIIIENEQVVSKSYPNFWKDLASAGFEIEQL